MINIGVHDVNKYLERDSFIEKEVVSRASSVAMTSFCCLEAAYCVSRTIGSSLVFTVIFPYEFFVSLRDLSSGTKGVKDSFSILAKRFNKLVLQECAKTILVVATIPLTPFVGLLSPRAMVAMHYEFGTATKAGAAQPSKTEAAEEKESDFVGFEDLLEIFDEYIDVLKDPKGAESYRVEMPAGLILHGPPGCGKTYAARHFTTYARSKGLHLNFIQMRGSEVVSRWVGGTMQNMKGVFESAKKKAPCVLFIDEFDGMFSERKEGSATADARNQDICAALEFIDEAKKHNVIVVGATNHLNRLDKAIIRSGRFDYTYKVAPPDQPTRLKMIQKKLETRGKKIEEGINYSEVAKATDGFTASDIDTLIKRVCLRAFRAKSKVTANYLFEAVSLSPKKKSSISVSDDTATRLLTPEEIFINTQEPVD